MYLHIGNGKSVRKDKIIGIFDLDTSTVSRSGKEFINRMEKDGLVEYDDFDLPRSYLLVEEGDGYRVRLSRISSQGLRQRAENRSPYGEEEKNPE
jgi:alkylation response protein AidB-like acyl-CoA dehydrogenase